MKKSLRVILAAVLVVAMVMLAGCNKEEAKEESSSASKEVSSTVSESIETADTPDFAEDDAKETDDQSGEIKPVILVVSFGTSYNDTREKTIYAIENRIADAYPDYEVRRAFTSQIIIDKLKERDGLEIDNVEEAFERLVNDGVKTLIVQPTHIMSGYEYDDLVEVVESYRDSFDELAVGAPLLTSDEDYESLAAAVVEETAEYNEDGTAIVFMGHGTEHESNAAYAKFQELFTANGNDNYYIGTVEATPSIDDIVELLKDGDYTRVILEPLMVVAGDHANNDMAGDEDDSWKSILEGEGYEVECVLKGLGEFESVQDIYVAHVNDAINSLGE